MSLHYQLRNLCETERTWCGTQFQVCRTSFTWPIHHFSSYNSFTPGVFISSAKFSFDEEEHNLSHLCLYPKGKTQDTENFLAVSVHSDWIRIEPVTCHVAIMDSYGNMTEKKSLTYNSNDSAGWDEFVSRNSLFKAGDLLLPDDELTLRCDLTMVRKVDKSWISSSDRPPFTTGDASEEETLCGAMGRLLEDNDKSSDVVFNVKDTKFLAHRAVLMARSKVFAAMFQRDMLEAFTNAVIVEDMEVPVFRCLLLYIYTDNASISSVPFAMQLLAAANRYIVPCLKSLCAAYLCHSLSESHVFDVAACADKFGESRLLQSCIQFICRDLENLVEANPDWRTKLRLHPEVLRSVLQLLPEEEKVSANLPFSRAVASEPGARSPQVLRGNLMWKVSGFSLCDRDCGDWIESAQFGVPGDTTTCILRIYPNGYDEESKGFVSVAVEQSPNDMGRIVCDIRFHTSNGNPSTVFAIKRSVEVVSYKFISREELLRGLPNDELIVSCTVSDVVPSSKMCAPTARKTNTLARDFGRIFAKLEFADVFLVVDGTTIPAHKTILMVRSPVLAARIKENPTEDSLHINDTKVEVFREMLRFVYTDKCYFKGVQSAKDIFDAAHEYQVSSLKTVCLKYLYDSLIVENVYDIAMWSLLQSETELYDACLVYICRELPAFNFLLNSLSPWKAELLPYDAVQMEQLDGIIEDLIERQGRIKLIGGPWR